MIALHMRTILLISPYWKEEHRWMVSSVKLAELWQRLGYRVVVACMGAQTSIEHVSPMLTIHRRRDLFLPDPWNAGIAFGFTGMVRRILRAEHPDLIVVNKVLFWSSLAAIALRCRGHRVLLLTDTLVGITWHPRGWFPRLVMRVSAWTLGWLVLLSAERIVMFHPQPAHMLRRLRVAGKTQVIPTGLDPGMFPVRTALPETERVVITYVGRLESVKGVDDFLAAAAATKKQHPRVHVQVVGWYKKDHPLIERYSSSVTFTGLRHDIPHVLQETDIFVLPSYSEGLSNALMEAMACGCACIASDVGGNRFLIHNGVSGFLFPPGDRAALAAHLRRLIEDPAKRRMLGETARKRIEEQFSWDSIGAMYEKLFEALRSTHS